MKIEDRYSTCVRADEWLYVDDEGYRNFIAEQIQKDLSKALISALYTKDAIVAIKGDSITQKDEYTCTINCRQDIYIKELVRCKDCKYHEDEEPGMVYCSNIVGGWVSENFYCGNAKRKDVTENDN